MRLVDPDRCPSLESAPVRDPGMKIWRVALPDFVRDSGRTGPAGRRSPGVSRLLIACVVFIFAFFTGCADGSGGTSSAPDDSPRTASEPADTEPTVRTEETPPGEGSSPSGADTTTPDSDEPSADLVREAVAYLYATYPVSFVEGNCFGYGAEADFGAVEDVDVTDRGAPESDTLGFTTGPLTGTRYPLALRVSFSNGLVGDYPAVLFRADSADGGGWYVNVNMCGWFQFA
jgi:hypothetical protein